MNDIAKTSIECTCRDRKYEKIVWRKLQWNVNIEE